MLVSVIRLNKIFIYTLVISSLLFTQTSYAVKKDVRIGVLAVWGEKVSYKMWQPTIAYLNKSLTDYHFTLKPITLKQTFNIVKQKNIEFIITNPGNYIELESRFGVSRLATLQTKKQNKNANKFGAVIFSQRDRQDIQSLQDLKNKSFMGVSKKAFGGFQIAWLELKRNDIDPFSDFSSLQFSGLPQDKIVYAVLKGEVDAGTVRTATLERMAKEGLINIDSFKIINRKQDSNFPFIHSSQLYPEWPIAKLKHTSDNLAKKLTIALLNLPTKSPAAKSARSGGWTVPLNYFPVHNLFKQLNLHPYEVIPATFLERYWGQSLLFFIFILQPLILYAIKLRVNLRIDEEKIAKSEYEWSNALDFLDEPMYMVDLNDRILRANKAYYQKRNTSAKEAVGQLVTKFSHPDGEDIPCKVCLARKNRVDTVIILEADDPTNKENIPLEINIKVILNNNNEPIGIIQRMRDLTKTRLAEQTLRRNETLFKELLNATPDPLIVSNSDGTIVLVNSQFEKVFGYQRKEIIGHKIEKLIPKKYHKKHIGIRLKYSQKPYLRPMGQDMKLVGQHKDGHIIPIDINLSPFTIDDEVLVITTIHNISARLKKEAELKRLASFPEYSPNPILEFEKGKKVTYANPAAVKLFPDLLVQGVKHEIFLDLENQYSSLEEDYELIRNINVSDSTFEQKIIYNPDTQLFRMYIWDITKLRNLTRKMSYHATHDVLTNLINRREFERKLNLANQDAQENNTIHSLCYMDLDQFKAVNDACGHAAGDELLKQLSSIINSKTRNTDTFARLGGDEFGLLLIGCPLEKAFSLAEEIRKTVENYRFNWDSKIFKVGISIGIALINKSSGSTKEIQSAADTACYIAKEQGRNQVHIYKTDSSLISKHESETNWFNRINNALDNNDFVLYFQKITSVKDPLHEHYEVLVRMIDTDGKTIPPNSFIPAAERFDIMTSIDSWVIKNTLLIMQEKKYDNIIFSVNLSGQSLSDAGFMKSCIYQIEDSKINPDQLCFEITETAMIANLSNAIHSVSKLRSLGCKIALDDFGSGLSSFSYLKNLPIDYLKIDGSLIKDIEKDHINVTMVKSIIYIGHSMGLDTVAEYVENDAVLNILKELKIDYVQGYGIAKPVPLEKVMPLAM